MANLIHSKEHIQAMTAKARKANNSKKTLKTLIHEALNSNSQAKLKELAKTTVARAIEGDPTAFKYLVDQLWPVSKDVSSAMPEVRVGIRLEGVDGSRVDAAVALGATVESRSSERSASVASEEVDAAVALGARVESSRGS